MVSLETRQETQRDKKCSPFQGLPGDSRGTTEVCCPPAQPFLRFPYLLFSQIAGTHWWSPEFIPHACNYIWRTLSLSLLATKSICFQMCLLYTSRTKSPSLFCLVPGVESCALGESMNSTADSHLSSCASMCVCVCSWMWRSENSLEAVVLWVSSTLGLGQPLSLSLPPQSSDYKRYCAQCFLVVLGDLNSDPCFCLPGECFIHWTISPDMHLLWLNKLTTVSVYIRASTNSTCSFPQDK